MKYIPLLCLLLLVACEKEEPATQHDYRKVVPHTGNLDADDRLSGAELEALQKATGKRAAPLDTAALNQLFDADRDRLTLFSFYQLDCAPCLQLNEDLEKLRIDWSEHDLEVVYVNLDDPSSLDEVNLHLRTSNLTGQTFQSDEATVRKIPNLDWNGELPLLLASQPSEELFIEYQMEFGQGVLAAMVETLVF